MKYRSCKHLTDYRNTGDIDINLSAEGCPRIGPYIVPEKLAKMAKIQPRFGDCLCGQRHGLAMNWVDRPRTSADERTLSGRRAVLIV